MGVTRFLPSEARGKHLAIRMAHAAETEWTFDFGTPAFLRINFPSIKQATYIFSISSFLDALGQVVVVMRGLNIKYHGTIYTTSIYMYILLDRVRYVVEKK